MRYILIPEFVYKSGISSSCSMTYGLIYSLSFAKGYCSATNQMLCEWLEISQKTLTTNLQTLRQKGFIRVEIDNYNLRYIFPLDENGKAMSSITKSLEKRERTERLQNLLN